MNPIFLYLILALLVLLFSIFFVYHIKVTRELKKKILDTNLVKNEAIRLLEENSNRKRIIFNSLCTSMSYLKNCEQDIGRVKKDLSFLFSDLKTYYNEIDKFHYKDERAYDRVLYYLGVEVKEFLNNESKKLERHKFFKFIDEEAGKV